MDLGDIKNKVKDMIGNRGGTDALKEDAEEVKDVATGEGSVTDKAKDTAEALKDPGAPGA
jgi:hypothetical protein